MLWALLCPPKSGTPPTPSLSLPHFAATSTEFTSPPFARNCFLIFRRTVGFFTAPVSEAATTEILFTALEKFDPWSRRPMLSAVSPWLRGEPQVADSAGFSCQSVAWRSTRTGPLPGRSQVFGSRPRGNRLRHRCKRLFSRQAHGGPILATSATCPTGCRSQRRATAKPPG